MTAADVVVDYRTVTQDHRGWGKETAKSRVTSFPNNLH